MFLRVCDWGYDETLLALDDGATLFSGVVLIIKFMF